MTDPGLWALFGSAFVSSTLLPGGSEAVLLVLALNPSYGHFDLLLVASLGNTLGGMTTWGLGRLLAHWMPHTRLRRKSHRLAVERLKKRGPPILLLSWVPVIGDPLCLAAGWLRVSPLVALAFIGLGKVLRYAAILVAVQRV